MNETYQWRGGTEMLLRHGVGSPVTFLILPALFEEANRMRRFTVSMMRNLAARGVGTILPDLPGTGESDVHLRNTSLQDWRDAVSALIEQASGTIAIRGGALLDGAFNRRWRLAPDNGERLLRDMTRATAFSEGLSAADIDRRARAEPTRIAGNLLSPEFYTALYAAVPVEGAHITTVEGPKLWRTAEPGDDPEFTRWIADDIAVWTNRCGA